MSEDKTYHNTNGNRTDNLKYKELEKQILEVKNIAQETQGKVDQVILVLLGDDQWGQDGIIQDFKKNTIFRKRFIDAMKFIGYIIASWVSLYGIYLVVINYIAK